MTHAELMPEILKLSDEEQLLIAGAICDRLGAARVVEEETRRELDRRIADLKDNPLGEAPWEVVRRRLRAAQ